MSRRTSMLLGVDAFATLVLLCSLVAVLPAGVPVMVAKEFYGLSASVLSIVFSVFTASLAIIISSPDDKFVQYLETEGLYQDILFGFKLTLLALFVALIYAILAFAWTVYQSEAKVHLQNRWGLMVAALLLAYALGATLTSTLAAIRHARSRADYLRLSE